MRTILIDRLADLRAGRIGDEAMADVILADMRQDLAVYEKYLRPSRKEAIADVIREARAVVEYARTHGGPNDYGALVELDKALAVVEASA